MQSILRIPVLENSLPMILKVDIFLYKEAKFFMKMFFVYFTCKTEWDVTGDIAEFHKLSLGT